MSAKARGLGKGLSALIGNVPNLDDVRKPVGYINKDISRIPVEKIEANPYQPRVTFGQESMEELADSIKVLGLIQPITVRRTEKGTYQIISGERRCRACKMAGMTMIPAYVREADDRGMMELALVENLQRSDLDPLETALGYRRLMEEFSLNQEQLAARVGKKRATVANTLRLLKLSPKIQHDLRQGLLSAGHAKALLSLEDRALQEKLCDKIVAEGLSVRETEDLVRRISGGTLQPGAAKPAAGKAVPRSYSRLQKKLGKYFKQDISVRRSATGKGSMTIRFKSDEEVEKFLAALDKASL